MKDILEYLIKAIVNHPDDVSIDKKDENGSLILSISTHKDDMGKVIGKNGKIIHAIRQVMKVPAIKQNARIRIELKEQA
ncbi:KH domain-containing protein [Candidatus Gottesmanbacteria bacterium]|nr:KH domain-containing protein [Candidatus Gottesmanbacteria bacterium]